MKIDYILTTYRKVNQSMPTSMACLAFLGLHFHQYNGKGK